ncbi:unnamed protein product [Caenorhabditis auriculariae]|uniref:DNA-directed DNA polymerase n=1 Tax=Caenorhabditis auriculariae TaxID=2777116 RepID=A0A8S1H4H5_9PELO|nr:unnamed protein product [Caenorhabditis auriculariae]
MGESYLVVKNQEQEAVLKLLSGKEEDRTRSRPDVSKLLLESICTGLTSSAEEMHQLVSFLFDSKSSDVSSSIEKLLKNSFISESCHEKGLNKLVATQLGKATLASSLPPEAALFIFDDLMTASKSICLDTELHMLYLVTPINVSVWQDCDWDHLYALFVQIPPEHRRVGKLVGMSEKYMLDRLQGQWKAHDKRLQVHIRFFSSLALYDLISEVPLNEVSAKYRISRGCLQTLQHQSSTYAAMVVAFCARLGWMYLKSLLDGFAMRLFFGIRSELSELVMIEGIDGHRARVFHEQGLTCLSQLAVCETTKVANVLSLAVPYSSEDENDGKREWLFGCYRMSLNEAAESLRQRARDCLLTRVRDLGLSVSFGQLEKAVFEEKSVAKPQSVTAESSFVDSGVASLPESFVPKKAPTNMISDGTMDKFNITMEELSLLDQEDELVFDNIGKSECADVFSQVDTLEMSLLAVRPPHKKDFYKKLTSVFASEVGASTSFKCSIEDTFQNSIIFTSKQGSVANSARRLSTASVLNQSGNSSFDVFGTPPTANRTTLKHRREASLTGPFSPSTSSPVQKQMRYEYSELNVKNPCRDLKSWNLWRRSIFAFNRIGLSLHVLSGKINTVHILHGDTVFEILISKAQNDDVNGVWTVVPLEQRLDALKTLLGRAETVLSSLSQCFTLYKNFKFRVLKPIIVSILNHILMNGEVDECYLDRRITDLSWDFDPLKYLQGDGSAASAMRAFAIGRVYQDIYPRAIAQSSSEYVSLELDAARVVSEIFYDGVPFDAIGCASAIAKLRKTIENLQSECFVFSKIPFNLDSSREVSNVVFCKLNLVHPGQQTSAKRHLSTSKTILEQISNQHPIVPKILQYRHLNYVISQCLTPLIEAVDKEDQRVRSTWDICTATGRILTSQPNIQNVPKTESSEKFFVRDLFRPREGYVMIGADYSQLELRVLAHLSGDSKLISFLVEERDFFSELSAKWGFTRVAVKQLCYGLIYGMGAKSLAESTKLSMDEAEQLRNNFFAIFPKVKTYIQETKDRANREGYVATLLGHKRLTNCSGKTEDRAREERVVVNYTIQGTASEIFKAAIVQIAKELSDWDARIVMLVHDEVLVEAKGELAEKVAAIVRTCMQNSLADRLKVPMRISLNEEMSDETTFCMRNFICEHTQELPRSDDKTLNKRLKFPVFHIFGVTDTGQKACVHVHGVLPYVVIRVGGSLTDGVKDAIRKKLNKVIQREIDNPMTKNSNSEYIHRVEHFRSKPMYGFVEEEEDFLRIYFTNPWYAQKVTFGLGKEVLDKPLFQAYEAHVPFHLQFFIDNSIFGMDMIHFKAVKYRLGTASVDSDYVYKELTVDRIRSNGEILSPEDKITSCEIECDAHVSDILNSRMHANNVYSSNPGLEYIWREEVRRQEQLGEEVVQPLPKGPPQNHKVFPAERDILREAKAVARGLRIKRGLNLTQRLENTMRLSQTVSAQDWAKEADERVHLLNFDEAPEDEEGELLDEEEEEKEEAVNFEMTMRADRMQENDEEEQQDDFEETSSYHASQSESDDENSAREILESSISIESEDGSNREKARSDGQWHWVTTPKAFEQKFVVGCEEAVEKEKNQVKKRNKRKSKSRFTCFSTQPPSPSYRQSPAAVAGSQILSQSSMDENETETDSDLLGVCVGSLELFIRTNSLMPDPLTDTILCASLSVFDDVCRTSCPKFHAIFLLHFRKMSAQALKQYSWMTSFDVDVLLGYDVERLSWGFLIRRAKKLNAFCEMSRFVKTLPQLDDNSLAPRGRLLVAVWKVVRSELTLRSYDRGAAMASVLHRKMPLFDDCTLTRYAEKLDKNKCVEIITYLLKISKLNVSLLVEMNWFIQSAEMARVYGIQFQEVWTRGSQLRVESMLLRLARKKGFVAPSISPHQRTLMSSPEQLQLILEPQSKVYHDPVIVLDFQSLYPSMVIAYNYCYTTIFGKTRNLRTLLDRKSDGSIVLGAMSYSVPTFEYMEAVAQKSVTASPLSSVFVKKSKREGLLPILLREILAARLLVKTAMKKATNKKLKRILDARQKALKLVANVTYGYTAANFSGRMPCAEVADAILGKGRETLERAIRMVASGNYGPSRVIYGDTDSLFVLVPKATLEEAFDIGRRIATDVSAANPDPVVLKLEKVYIGCVLETKKRYAGWMFESEKDEGKLDSKGIETVRRDTAPIVAKVLERSLELIFKKLWRSWATYLNTTIATLEQVPYVNFVFCKEFRGEYSEQACVPQKKIAELRQQACPSYVTLRGERVPYIIVDSEPGSTVYSGVCPIEDFIHSSNLKINVAYYLRAHILPALRRVTDLLPTQLVLAPLRANHCLTQDCIRIGRSPWCVECDTMEEPLAQAVVQAAKEERAKVALRIVCLECRTASHRIGDAELNDCVNWACTVKQAWNGLKRSPAFLAVSSHSLAENTFFDVPLKEKIIAAQDSQPEILEIAD